MSEMIPWQFRRRIRSALEFPARRAAGKRLALIRRSEHLAVGFGDALDERRPVHGGAVKLLPLRNAFGGDEREFSLLYAVSSRQPGFAEDLLERCRQCGIRIVWNQNGVGYPAWAGNESERFNKPMRALRAMADYVIYQSEFCRISADKFLGPCGLPSEILYNPVDLEKFRPAEIQPPAKPLRLLTLGTHGYPERVFSTIHCLDRLRREGVETELTIAGRFQWKAGGAQVSGLIRQLGLENYVAILPPFSQEEAAGLYRKHHLVLHPKYMDPCPTVAIEALASGCPVVGSRSGGMPELVGSDCGVLVDAETDWSRMITPTGVELAGAVQLLASRLEAARKASRQRAERLFDVRKWVDRHAEIFSGLLR
ncbi:MAG: glycosyltransferase [Verrucomicrobiaceae bacterium]|nr:MAG: glycosyltransferase [Verrucomicrobiaceae bacterium]